MMLLRSQSIYIFQR